MMNWKKERPLTGTEGLIKGLHPTSSTDCWFIQPCRQGMGSFVQVGVPIREIVEGLLAQGRCLNGK